MKMHARCAAMESVCLEACGGDFLQVTACADRSHSHVGRSDTNVQKSINAAFHMMILRKTNTTTESKLLPYPSGFFLLLQM